VVGTSRTQAKLDHLAEAKLVVDHAILARDGRFAVATKERVGGAHLVFDPVGAAYLADNLSVLLPQGRLVVYGLMGGRTGEIALGDVLRKRLRIVGTVLRSRTAEEKATVAQEVRRHVLPLFERGLLEVVIDSVAPMAEIADAHRRMASNESIGKIVMRW
jgi:NADPH:quinone reductase-like Zn-dependent oxidoreductase